MRKESCTREASRCILREGEGAIAHFTFHEKNPTAARKVELFVDVDRARILTDVWRWHQRAWEAPRLAAM